MIKLLFPPNGLFFDTYTDIQNDFVEKIKRDGIDSAHSYLVTVKENKERSYPNFLCLKWEDENEKNFVLEISETEDFIDSIEYKTNLNSFKIDNLKTGIQYFWRVNGCEPNYFTTRPRFARFILLEGALNVRDIGGYKIKQGMFYRGSALDPPFYLSKQGVFTFESVLKIKTEIELRKDAIVNSKKCFWSDKTYKIHLPYRPYLEVFEDEHKRNIKHIMEFLSDKSVYPVYVHCHGGADRTGMIALYLRALLGEEDEIIHTDYELTSLSTYALGIAEGAEATGFRSRLSSYYQDFLTRLRGFAPNEPLSVCVTKFLLSCGVSEEVLNKIKNILKNNL